MDRSILELPFYGDEHRKLSEAIFNWASTDMPAVDHHDTDNACRQLVTALGKAGFLRYCVPAAYGGALDALDSRSLCIARETLAYHDGLADFAFAMQGLGTGAITLSGSEEMKRHVLPKTASGEWIAAFALTEPDAGSDVGAMACEARLEGEHYVINGEKTWISNGGIADVYCLFARTGEAPGTRGISAFVIYPDMPGFEIAERLDVIAPHPLARLRFTDMKVPVANRLGAPGEGFKVAMRTLDIFRSSVAAAALGFARRALDEALAHARKRPMFGHTLADFQLTQAKLGDMATDIEAGALLTARAAWRRDVQKLPTTREAAMAKMTATENAQRVIDAAVQIHGGQGVRTGVKVESLYREIRALRIYEGATEVQKLIVARELMK
ncbi:acyl-CoA dehydrogenase [Azoarcus sp. TTM-91]|uniref:acyl-CoA dehydrogenase family protein n=1 Tax=Azoarcus sp. TTM-91 TaxID=2691581 RepID=UPI00145EC0C6|nr:acyl-CoA dehydrogenase family protein [Azoarcus sp. TTM-91]NMG36470.1 acyl-CoA dehydrogenase [Azoarcus sp. TTM-91]